MKSWADVGFKIEITGDGSPSLRLLKSLREDRPDGEAMHHSGGAAAETDLIYGSCVKAVFEACPGPAFLVVGLGLGYIEMVIAREALAGRRTVSAIRSFESVPELRGFFHAWLHGRELASEISRVYDQAADFVIRESEFTTDEIRRFLRPYFPAPDSICGSLDAKTEFPSRFHGILYDAFSSKTSPELWDENFLAEFLAKSAAETSFLATYACKGSLKKALKTQSFEIIQKPGFQGKRNSLFARRTP